MDKKVKVLHIVESFGGGVFSFLVDLVNSTSYNYDITIAYGVRKETPDNFKEYFNKNVKFVEIKNFTRDINLKKDLKAIKEVRKIVKELNPNVVHMHSSKAGAIGRLAVSAKRRKLLYNPHGFSFLKMDISNLKRLLYKVLEKVLSLRKCTVVACSEGEYDEALKITKNSICINNSLNLDKMNKITKKINKREIDYNNFKICTVGRIDFSKNPELFNEIAKSFPNIKFTWIGDGELKEKLTSSNINITGWLKKEEVVKLLNENDIFILSSLWEGMPLSLLEAMYMKKICIVSNCIGNRDVITNGENGFICNSLEDYKNAIQNIIDNKIEYDKIIENARKDIENKFSIEIMSKKYEEAYKKIILHIVNSKDFSGLEKVAIDIIKELSNDYNSYYVTRDGSIVERLERENVKRIKIDRMSIKEIRRICKEYKPDIVHAHDYTATVITAFSFVRVPIISHLHNNSPWIKKVNKYSFALLFASLRVKKILTVSEAIKNEYVFSKIIGKKIENIGNPVSVKEIAQKVPNEVEKKYDICFVGRLTKAKNPIKFINIVAKLKKNIPYINVVMIGDGELRINCEEEIYKLKLQNNIELKGFVENPYSIMVKSKIFCLTSDWEGYGLVAFEALALGLPAVVTKVGGLVDIVDSNCGAFCESVDQFAETIKNILLNENEYYEKSKQAIIKANNLDNKEKYMKKIKNVYDIILK